MADLIAIECGCGFRADNLAAGGLLNGVAALFRCEGCANLVSALVWSSGRDPDLGAGPLEPLCEACGGERLTPWGGPSRQGPCPRCGLVVVAQVVGIAD